MKTINVPLENDEYRKLARKKGNLSWHDFVLKLTEGRPARQKPLETRHEFKQHFPHSKVDGALLKLVGTLPEISPAEEKRELEKAIAESP